MPFSAQALTHLEDALAEGFQYHQALDQFVLRSGLTSARLASAREKAEERAKASTRQYNRAPKRLVVQEILGQLCGGPDADDRLIAGLVTAICKASLKDATSVAQTAQASLIALQASERQEAETRREAERELARSAERERERATVERGARREQFRDYFLQLSSQSDPQARGYMLEKFLNDFLSFEKLNPRSSFRLVGEQIDGSFSWSGRTYLVEARWVKEPVAGIGFSSLMYKIQGKTADTRGLFVSINGYSVEAIQGLRLKGELRFVCLDGVHLIRCLEPGGSFPELLEKVWRHANETGEAYIPVSAMKTT